MKLSYRNIAGVVLLIAMSASASYAQQQFTQTVTRLNKSCNATCSVLDVPELNNNPVAIILVTPVVENGVNLNPHPIGAYFMYLKKWSIYNLDGTAIAEGAKFNVQYFVNPGPDRFVYIVPRQVRLSDIPFIDHDGLNDNPNAQIRLFPTSSPTHGALYNKDDVKAIYDATAHKWFIANVNNKPVPWEAVYNIVISSGGIANTNPQAPVNPAKDKEIRDPVNIVPPSQTNTPPVKGPLTPPAIGRWILFDDLQPTIAPNSEILLFIHGMDSRAEEADDITRALFALQGNMPESQATPTPTPAGGPSQNPQMVPVLQGLLQKYKGCILERYETQQDMINRGLNGNLSGLSNTNGLQARDANVACVAGNMCSLASRAASFVTLQAQANRGDPVNFQSNLEKAIPVDCFLCQKHQEMHTKHVHCTMEAGGNNGFPQGPNFEACKAGVDITALANSVINDISGVISDITGIRPPAAEIVGGPSVATNFSTVRFTSCPDPAGGCPETCDHPDNFSGGQRAAVVPYESVDGRQVPLYYEPSIPPNLLDTPPPPNQQINVPAAHNIGKNEGRLRPDLRKAAADADPLKSLRLAAYQFAAGDTVTGKAFADLSVTGHKAFATFSKALPKESFCQSLTGQRPPQLNENDVLNGCRTALDRAYRVANFLRTGQRGDTPAEKTRKTNERIALGWIAVSGEDDSPHRPVNVPSSDFPQYDIPVVVEAPLAARSNKTVTVRTRYVIAQSQSAGNGSTAKNLVVISLDLPTSGYSENLDYELVSPLAEIGNPKWTPLPVPVVVPSELLYAVPGLPPVLPPGFVIPPGTPLPDFQATGKTPLLDFIENFIVRFAETLDQKVPIKNNIKAVMGGSLGGNMTFRLGRRPGVPWLPKFVVWSPASIWSSLGEGGDLFKHFGPRTAWESANKANKSPGEGDRAEFFGGWDKPIVPVIIPMAQSDTWTSDYYACKKSSVAGARLDRQETYDARFLAWHWRLGAEQLLYSHQTIDPATNQPRYMSNQKPMLLGCGTEDHVAFNDICPATQSTARLMTLTPGKALFLDKTGHSLDNERRSYWARQIVEFLGLQ
ncbi:MAG TPA: hypothetical protein DCK93_00840 [Blastocatellia bacterium]|jgi:hypothetical protein|nr:hypothetical protein [Blastocatellia bacterium]HAF21452.1 hypothetical protein [Blastocatellia bacterium]